MSTLWESRYSLRARETKSSAIRELLKISEQPGVISFAGEHWLHMPDLPCSMVRLRGMSHFAR